MQLFKKRPIIINLSKLYRTSMFILVSVMLLAQLALTTPGAKAVLTFIGKFEGAVNTTSSGTLGEITLTLLDAEPSSDIEILQNGQPIAMFYDKQVRLTVSDNSVIEIDGRKIKTPFMVELSNISPNIEIENNITLVSVNSNISLVGRIFIK